MLTARSVLLAALAVAALSACSRDEAARGAGATATRGPTVATPTDDGAIPAALRGRWGMVPADCEPGRSDAKGLLEIGPDTLRFYEARAVAGAVSASDPTQIRATFHFQGEGMEWNREELLQLDERGEALIRQEFGEEAAPSPFHYRRCP